MDLDARCYWIYLCIDSEYGYCGFLFGLGSLISTEEFFLIFLDRLTMGVSVYVKFFRAITILS